MKIAVMGSAASSVGKAPFKDERFDAWVQGRVPSEALAHAQLDGSWDIWGCSPGCWAVIPRATRWFEVHRWEPEQQWFGPEYAQFLRTFKGPVYTGGRIPEIPNHVLYPIDRMEEKFSSYNMTSSLALMMALAIDTVELIRVARKAKDAALLPAGIDAKELEKGDSDDVIGMWGVDMAAQDEYAYQRPGCQNFVLEAMRRDIAVYLPPESDLMRPMPVYGVSEWDHNYIKLTARARELNQNLSNQLGQVTSAQTRAEQLRGELGALQGFVSTWTSPYGMMHGMVIRQAPGTGLGSGITHFDGRPVERMGLGAPAKATPAAPAASNELSTVTAEYAKQTGRVGNEADLLRMAFQEAAIGREQSTVLQEHCLPGESTVATIRRLVSERDAALKPKKAKRRR